jgi:hypothetical protein
MRFRAILDVVKRRLPDSPMFASNFATQIRVLLGVSTPEDDCRLDVPPCLAELD